MIYANTNTSLTLGGEIHCVINSTYFQNKEALFVRYQIYRDRVSLDRFDMNSQGKSIKTYPGVCVKSNWIQDVNTPERMHPCS